MEQVNDYFGLHSSKSFWVCALCYYRQHPDISLIYESRKIEPEKYPRRKYTVDDLLAIKEKLEKIKEVPFTMCLSMIILAVVCLFGGLLLIPYYRVFLQTAGDVLLTGKGYANLVFQAVK